MESASDNPVLIIQDECDMIDFLALNLRKAAFATSTAADGAAGLEKARSEKPAFIILDLMLPKMPGLEICKILKGDPATLHIPNNADVDLAMGACGCSGIGDAGYLATFIGLLPRDELRNDVVTALRPRHVARSAPGLARRGESNPARH